MIGGLRHVFKSARPAPALIAYPAVFDAPGRDADFGQRRAQMAHIRKAVLRHPTPAMNHDGDGMRPRALGQSQVAELKFVRAVRQTMIDRRSWTSQNIAGRLPLPGADDGERRDRGQRERNKHDWSGNVSEHPSIPVFFRRSRSSRNERRPGTIKIDRIYKMNKMKRKKIDPVYL